MDLKRRKALSLPESRLSLTCQDEIELFRARWASPKSLVRFYSEGVLWPKHSMDVAWHFSVSDDMVPKVAGVSVQSQGTLCA